MLYGQTRSQKANKNTVKVGLMGFLLQGSLLKISVTWQICGFWISNWIGIWKIMLIYEEEAIPEHSMKSPQGREQSQTSNVT